MTPRTVETAGEGGGGGDGLLVPDPRTWMKADSGSTTAPRQAAKGLVNARTLDRIIAKARERACEYPNS